jgi:hypothetical protein
VSEPITYCGHFRTQERDIMSLLSPGRLLNCCFVLSNYSLPALVTRAATPATVIVFPHIAGLLRFTSEEVLFGEVIRFPAH